jgi:hypothetical protein
MTLLDALITGRVPASLAPTHRMGLTALGIARCLHRAELRYSYWPPA